MLGGSNGEKNDEEVKDVGGEEGISEEQSLAIKYDWENKWLKGDEYHHILIHADIYMKALKFEKYPPKTHPVTTYASPISISVNNFL
jgi:hypothetical protein